jgi:cell division septum initiation protein DivIVA
MMENNIMEEAQSEAARNMEETQCEATSNMEEAQSEAARIVEEAQSEAARIVEEAQCEAARIMEDAKGSADLLIEKYLKTEQKNYKYELNKEMSRFTNERLEDTKRAAATHTEMCDATNALQVKWIQTLDDALHQMTSVKAEFYAHLHDWQVSLFSSEIKPLAERYLELYRIINVDKLLREAILFQNSTEIPDAITAGLQKLNKTLTTFLRRFEAALNGLDLYVYYPNVGDMFDDMWHIPDDEEEEYYGKQIKECIIPGIAKKANDDYGDDVLIPAVVKVEVENEHEYF